MGGLNVYSDSIHLNLTNPAAYSQIELVNYSVGVDYNSSRLISDNSRNWSFTVYNSLLLLEVFDSIFYDWVNQLKVNLMTRLTQMQPVLQEKIRHFLSLLYQLKEMRFDI